MLIAIFNLQFTIYNKFSIIKFSNLKKEYDLEKRTTKFGEEIVLFCRSVKQDTINRPIISQLVRSGTSVGANYCEANNACSKKDF
jgi:hypothetical protein